MQADYIQLRDRRVGVGHPAYIIAEIGANHNGDMSLAKELIAAAKDCGCDAVKFQLWDRYVGHTESYIRKLNQLEKLGDVDLKSPSLGLNTVADQIEKFQCGRDQHVLLKEYADSLGIHFASTCVTEGDLDFLVDLGVDWLKIASMDTDHPHFIRYVAEKNMPTFMSTGLSTWQQAAAAVDCFKPEFMKNLSLMHCISLYPPDDSVIHLRKMRAMHEIFGVGIGYSDHSIGFSIPLAAIALGAVSIEKHFTLDKTLPGWDHKVSADPAEMSIICREARRITVALGEASPEVSAAEMKKADHFRRSIVTTKPVRKGDTISMDMLFFKRPGTGIRPYELKYVLGRIASRDIAEDELILWEDLV
jgi:sialic acid synthase SpsE